MVTVQIFYNNQANGQLTELTGKVLFRTSNNVMDKNRFVSSLVVQIWSEDTDSADCADIADIIWLDLQINWHWNPALLDDLFACDYRELLDDVLTCFKSSCSMSHTCHNNNNRLIYLSLDASISAGQ